MKLHIPDKVLVACKSLPAWGAWIEIIGDSVRVAYFTSLPAWGAWIEISTSLYLLNTGLVAPRMGGVD